jgi:hypothetical protein
MRLSILPFYRNVFFIITVLYLLLRGSIRTPLNRFLKKIVAESKKFLQPKVLVYSTALEEFSKIWHF